MRGERKPKVSVCVITYNQVEFIRECLQSIVDQQTDFDFEVVVGDDCSTDGTAAIVEEFALRYPRMVKPVLRPTNIGGSRNLLLVHQQATGSYIAHMDGDDFMLPGKLQIQAENLDENPDCVACFHAVKHYDQRNNQYRTRRPINIPRKIDINFLLLNLTRFVHSSKMYRAENQINMEFSEKEVLDAYLHICHGLNGKILYLSDILGVYRSNVGISTITYSNNQVYHSPNPKILDLLIDAIDYAGQSGIDKTILTKAKSKAYLDFSYGFLMSKDYDNFSISIYKSWATGKLNHSQRFLKYFSGLPNLLFRLARLRALLIEKLL